MVLGVIDGTIPADYWLAQGGIATLRSYGVEARATCRAIMSNGCVPAAELR